MVLMLLAKLNVASVKPSLYWSATSTDVLSDCFVDVDRPRLEDDALAVEVADEALDAALEVERELAVVALVEDDGSRRL